MSSLFSADDFTSFIIIPYLRKETEPNKLTKCLSGQFILTPPFSFRNLKIGLLTLIWSVSPKLAYGLKLWLLMSHFSFISLFSYL